MIRISVSGNYHSPELASLTDLAAINRELLRRITDGKVCLDTEGRDVKIEYTDSRIILTLNRGTSESYALTDITDIEQLEPEARVYDCSITVEQCFKIHTSENKNGYFCFYIYNSISR